MKGPVKMNEKMKYGENIAIKKIALLIRDYKNVNKDECRGFTFRNTLYKIAPKAIKPTNL